MRHLQYSNISIPTQYTNVISQLELKQPLTAEITGVFLLDLILMELTLRSELVLLGKAKPLEGKHEIPIIRIN